MLYCSMYRTFADSYAYRETCKFLSSWSVITLGGNHRDWHWLPASCTQRGSLLFIKTSTTTSGITESRWSRRRGYDMVRRASPTTLGELLSPSSSNGVFIKRRNVLMAVRTFVFLSSPCAVTNRAIFISRENPMHADFKYFILYWTSWHIN